MASRMIRDGILTSRNVDRLSDAGEIFYRRLLSVVDDFGRYFADPAVLRAHLYPLRLDRMPETAIAALLREVSDANLVQVYEDEGKAILQVRKFDQQIRIKRSKFPAPPLE